MVSAVSWIAVACSDQESARVTERATEATTPLTVPAPALDHYVVLSSTGATFGQRCIVGGGDVGVAAGATATPNTLTSANDSQLAVGHVSLAPRVVLGARVISGEIGADSLVAPASARTGPRSAFVAPPAVPTVTTVNPGANDVNVDAGQTMTLAAGRFGSISVRGTLRLSGGVYELRSLDLQPDARLLALTDSSVRISMALSLRDRASALPNAPLGSRSLRFSVGGADAADNSVTLGADARLNALTVAQRTLRAADRAQVTGSIAARNVVFGNDTRLRFDAGFECNGNAMCDDGDPCTLDACMDVKCIHTAVPNGSICDDGDACTRTDACQAGHCVGQNPVTCHALDACHVAGTCDSATGSCSNPVVIDGTACDDDDPCSLGDRCEAGVCRAGTALKVSEYATGLSQARSLTVGPGGQLWFVSPASTAVAYDGSLAQVSTAGIVTKTLVSRDLGALVAGPDGMLWIAERLVGGSPALGRYDGAARRFSADFTGIIAHELAATSDDDAPVIWFTGGSSIGRITPAGELLAPVPTLYVTRAITAAAPAPRSVLWVTEANGGGFAMIGRLAYPRLEQFAVTTSGELSDIVEGPDNGIWFTDPARNEVGRMPATGGTPKKFSLPSAASQPFAIASGVDGNLWVTLRAANKLARITPEGVVTEVCVPTARSDPRDLAIGPDGNVWFLEAESGKIGRIEVGRD